MVAQDFQFLECLPLQDGDEGHSGVQCLVSLQLRDKIDAVMAVRDALERRQWNGITRGGCRPAMRPTTSGPTACF